MVTGLRHGAKQELLQELGSDTSVYYAHTHMGRDGGEGEVSEKLNTESPYVLYSLGFCGIPFVFIIIFWGLSQKTEDCVIEKCAVKASCSRKRVFFPLITCGGFFPSQQDESLPLCKLQSQWYIF